MCCVTRGAVYINDVTLQQIFGRPFSKFHLPPPLNFFISSHSSLRLQKTSWTNPTSECSTRSVRARDTSAASKHKYTYLLLNTYSILLCKKKEANRWSRSSLSIYLIIYNRLGPRPSKEYHVHGLPTSGLRRSCLRKCINLELCIRIVVELFMMRIISKHFPDYYGARIISWRFSVNIFWNAMYLDQKVDH